MSSGLLALLDDVAAIAKVAASSLDDVVAQTGKAGAKAVGIVIDDAAVTPRYVVGFAADRELPIIARIALGSLKNKLLILLPGALLLGLFAPWAITPLLMLGGAFLCFEGTEKVHDLLHPHDRAHAADASDIADAKALEDAKIASAVRTDMILSAEIMAITLAAVTTLGFWMQAIVLAVVGIGVTALVYGAVALIVKADDAGVALAARSNGLTRALGRALVQGVPPFLAGLSLLGTAAMLWVGGGIVLHGLEQYGLKAPMDAIHALAHAVAPASGFAKGFVTWLVEAVASGIFGLALGVVVVWLVGRLGPLVTRMWPAQARK